jgi:hypothetical protein
MYIPLLFALSSLLKYPMATFVNHLLPLPTTNDLIEMLFHFKIYIFETLKFLCKKVGPCNITIIFK